MPRKLMTALLPLFSLALLSACGASETVVTRVETVRVTVPASLLDCPEAPIPPAGEGLTQADIAVYLTDLTEAHGACRLQLEAIRSLMQE